MQVQGRMRVCAAVALAFMAALHLPQVLGELNASAKHGTYEAADLSAVSRAETEGQELQDLLHWAICKRPNSWSALGAYWYLGDVHLTPFLSACSTQRRRQAAGEGREGGKPGGGTGPAT